MPAALSMSATADASSDACHSSKQYSGRWYPASWTTLYDTITSVFVKHNTNNSSDIANHLPTTRAVCPRWTYPPSMTSAHAIPPAVLLLQDRQLHCQHPPLCARLQQCCQRHPGALWHCCQLLLLLLQPRRILHLLLQQGPGHAGPHSGSRTPASVYTCKAQHAQMITFSMHSQTDMAFQGSSRPQLYCLGQHALEASPINLRERCRAKCTGDAGSLHATETRQDSNAQLSTSEANP